MAQAQWEELNRPYKLAQQSAQSQPSMFGTSGGMPNIPIGSLFNILQGGGTGAGTGAISSTGAGAGEATGIAGALGGGGGEGLAAGAGGAAMANPITAILAAAAALSAGSLIKGMDQGQSFGEAGLSTFGGEGWAGPMGSAVESAVSGDWKDTFKQLGGADPNLNLIFTPLSGGGIEDMGKNLLAPFYNIQDIGEGSNPFLDIINLFSSPWMARK